MDNRLKLGFMGLAAVIALVAIGAMGALADPVDTDSPPTSDWVFDAGKTTTISQKVWTVSYNITVTNGSVLKIEDCTWTMDGVSPWNPVWIYTDVNSTFELLSSTFNAAEGSTGFYIEAHANITITDCEFTGIVENTQGDAGIAVYGNKNVTAELNFVEISDTWMSDGLYFENCQVDIANCEVHDIEGNGIGYFVGDNDFNENYTMKMIDTNIYNVNSGGFRLWAYTNYGHAWLNFYNVDVYNTSEEGVSLDVGDHSSTDNGNGSVLATFDYMEIYDIGDQAIYTSNLYQRQGTAAVGGLWMNQYNVTLTNSKIHDVKNTGIYVQLVYTYLNYNLVVDQCEFWNISLDANFDRLGGIWWWYQSSSGGANLYVSNTTFRRCTPAGFDTWDYGGNNFNFYNCNFTRNAGHGILLEVRQSASQSPCSIDGCNFFENEGYGVRTNVEYSWQGGQTPVLVTNSSFCRNELAALSVTAIDYGKNFGFNITNCSIYEHTSYAVEMSANYPQGAIVLHVVDSWINDTAGIKSSFTWGYTGGAGFDFLFINSSIENSSADAISLVGGGYQPIKGYAFILNSTISGAGGDGFKMSLGASYKSTTFSINGHVQVRNSTIMDCGGVGIVMSVDSPDYGGAREFEITNTTIRNTQRALFNYDFTGEMWYVDVRNSLKEDLFIIDARVDVWYCTFTRIDDMKFKALEGGQVYFYWDMNIYVKWDTGAAALGANVQIFDNQNTLIAVLPVENRDGSLPTFTMNSYFVRETGVFSSTPYIINCSFLKVSRTVGVKLDRNREVVVILEDHYEPEIYILYPKEGHVQQFTTLQVRGSAWDSQSGIQGVYLSLDGDVWERARGSLRWNHTFKVSDELIGRFSGIFNLRAKAIDNANNEKVAFVQIRIDPTPPELTLDFPYDGYITNNPELWVRGVTELGSKIEINSVPVPVVVSMFTHKVTLVEGQNTISVISIDPLGNIQIERLTVHLDTQKPFIILTSPEEEGAMTNEDTILVEAQVEEALSITVNGYEVPYDSEWYVKDSGVMTFEVGLEPGDNAIVIQARDKADNLLVIDRIVTYDTTPPWIQVITPRAEQILPKPEVTIVGTVDPTATLTIDGEDVTVQNGYFERIILALEGRNTVPLVATDAAGNVYEENLVFTIDIDDPMVTITRPQEAGMIVNEVRYTIEGTVAYTDDTGAVVVTATSVLLNGAPYTYIDDGTGQVVRTDIELNADGTFAIPVDLLEGKNEFTIEVRDEVGNRATTTRTIRLDTRAPTLVMYISPILIKEDGVFTNALTINITGYTDPGSVLEINTILLPVDEDGQFKTPLDLQPGENTITIISVDAAENERTIIQTITYEKFKPAEEETDTGLWFLIIALVILIAAAVFATYYVRGRREDWLEMEAAEASPLAPELETVIEEPDTLPGPDELELEEEEEEEEPAPTTAPPRPRPRPPQARRGPAPRPVPKPVEKPEVEGKDLIEKDTESDIEADETDQEGI